MDMNLVSLVQSDDLSFDPLRADFERLSEQRRRVFVLIREFQCAVARPEGIKAAIGVLKALLSSAREYFSLIEALLDGITPAGAEPHRAGHRRILHEMTDALETWSATGALLPESDLSHALDALVIHEVAIRMRDRSEAVPVV